ncbi:hypothetical protein CJ030_MR1G015689 [Morella rubra]|uniref:Uncharacterized protein n=1 Tax=Morella rubra TaxID=262757 RepID=A0A6A1WJI4_9ROSI|nr:hypothetical protein CJ030_MR1G015689 [Morella rubra]
MVYRLSDEGVKGAESDPLLIHPRKPQCLVARETRSTQLCYKDKQTTNDAMTPHSSHNISSTSCT